MNQLILNKFKTQEIIFIIIESIFFEIVFCLGLFIVPLVNIKIPISASIFIASFLLIPYFFICINLIFRTKFSKISVNSNEIEFTSKGITEKILYNEIKSLTICRSFLKEDKSNSGYNLKYMVVDFQIIKFYTKNNRCFYITSFYHNYDELIQALTPYFDNIPVEIKKMYVLY